MRASRLSGQRNCAQCSTIDSQSPPPLKTPFKESDPRHMPPNFYFEQADFLRARQPGKRWSWTELRPQTLCGLSPGTPMSIVTILACYAAILKELGLPLRFPGRAWNSIYQVTDSEHFARAAHPQVLDRRLQHERSASRLPQG